MTHVELEQLLNAQQLQAALTIDGPLLILAGAGSGKTRVITHRIAYMLDTGIQARNILALTFTNKAAHEMHERISTMVGSTKARRLTVSTFHAFGAQLLRKYIEHLGWRTNFSIYDTADQFAMIKNIFYELEINSDDYSLREILNAIVTIKNCKAANVTVPSHCVHYSKFHDEYVEHMQLYNAVDFDDLILLPLVLLREHESVRRACHERYKYIMVDEFQDTSITQYYVLELLASAHKNLCVVGDDDQSIYSWRGANMQNIECFERDFAHRLEVKLEQNYRSTGTILHVANKVIENNSERKEKALWTHGDGGAKISIYTPENEQDEARLVCELMSSISFKENIAYEKMGILMRTNALSRHIEEALLGANISYTISGGTSFFQRQEIKDIIAYLRVITNHNDDISLLRILNRPRRGIGKKTLEKIQAIADEQKVPIYQCIAHIIGHNLLPERYLNGLREFMEIIEQYRTRVLSSYNMAETVRDLVHDINYWGYLVQEFYKQEHLAKARYRNINFFITFIEKYERNPNNESPNIFQYLNRITLQTKDEKESEKGSVNISTIHAAKGLEYDVVFVIGVEEGIIPHERSLQDDREHNHMLGIQEERRLFYVAITRAKKHLFLMVSRMRTVLQESKECSPSSFIAEMPENLVQWCEDTSSNFEVDENDMTNYFAKLHAKFS